MEVIDTKKGKNKLTVDKMDVVTEKSERRVLSGLTSVHVVGHLSASTTLIPQLERRDNRENLPLGSNRDKIPLRLGAQVSRGVRGSSQSLRPGEDEVRLNAVSDESKHGNTAVLDFSMTKESNGGLVGGSPEFGFRKVKRIVKSNNGVKLLSKNLKVSLYT